MLLTEESGQERAYIFAKLHAKPKVLAGSARTLTEYTEISHTLQLGINRNILILLSYVKHT